jgi:AcrR family transcriptional regulator
MALESVAATAPSAGRGTDPSRRQRSDAQRNVVALVESATTVFAGSGVDAPAKEITDLAGVGVGTLYRHFPRRSDLIVAVLQHEIDECVAAAEELGTTLSPREALMGWIERFTDFVGTKRGLASALHSGDPAYDDLPQHLLDRLEPALQTLLARAADGGYARGDVTAREVLMTIALMCQPVPGEQPSFHQRMTRVFMEGLVGPAGQGQAGTNADHHDAAGSADDLQTPRGAGKPAAGGARDDGPDAVRH